MRSRDIWECLHSRLCIWVDFQLYNILAKLFAYLQLVKLVIVKQAFTCLSLSVILEAGILTCVYCLKLSFAQLQDLASCSDNMLVWISPVNGELSEINYRVKRYLQGFQELCVVASHGHTNGCPDGIPKLWFINLHSEGLARRITLAQLSQLWL